jgi:hypothetical protein
VSPQGDAHWLADTSFGPLSPRLAAAAAWEAESADTFPWPAFGLRRLRKAPADAAVVARPDVSVVVRDGRRLQLKAFLTPAAWGMSVHVREPARLQSAVWRGQAVGARQEGEWQSITVLPGAERSIALELEFSSALPEGLEISELLRELPAQGKHLIEARAPTAVASQLGDVSLVRTRVAVPPIRESSGAAGLP